MLKAVKCFTLFGAVLLSAHAVFAQGQTHPPRVALEVSRSGEFLPDSIVPEHGASSTLMTGPSMFLPEQGTTNASGSRPSALKLTYRVEQDVVALTVSVLFGSFNVNDTPRSLQGISEKEVGTYSLRLNESIVLRELETFRLRPLTIKVVSAVPENPLQPHILSNAPSIQVEMVSQDRSGYRLTVRNTSTRPVIQYAFGRSMVDQTDLAGSVSSYGTAVALIAPGGIREQTVFCNHAVDPTPCDFVLQTAVFEDGSYEGDAKFAALLETRRLAGDLQRQRVQGIVNNTMQTTDNTASSERPPVSATIARIREQLELLPDNPDDATSETIDERIRSHFPGLAEDSKMHARFRVEILSELRGEKASALRSLNDYEQYCKSFEEHSRSAHSQISKLSLSQWLANRMTMGVTLHK